MRGSPQHLEFGKKKAAGGQQLAAPETEQEYAMDRDRQGPSKDEYERLRADLGRFFTQLGKAYSPGN